MKNTWFFDLEDTLIDVWGDWTWVKEDKIRSIMDRPDFNKNIFIYSWAIWNDQDREYGEHFLYPLLKEKYGLNVVGTITRNRLLEILKEKFFYLDDSDFNEMYDKERSFIDYCRLTKKQGNLYLVDDTVEDCIFKNKDFNIEFINV
jgi:FMN phosphatase YigB (HAD superfamily)